MKTALVLSGGGANGAWQAGVLDILAGRYQFDAVSGVSVGALNGLLVAQGRIADLVPTWLGIEERQIHHRYSWPRVALRLLCGKRGAWSLEPLRRLIEKEAAVTPLKIPLKVGYVELGSGAYVTHTMPAGSVARADPIWYSAIMPLVWEPGAGGRVDGGLRQVSPIGTILDYQPDRVVLVYCQPPGPVPVRNPKKIDGVAKRVLDILVADNLEGDLRRYQDRNWAAFQFEAATGQPLIGPGGKIWRNYDTRLYRPESSVGETLDFSPETIADRVRAGREYAWRTR